METKDSHMKITELKNIIANMKEKKNNPQRVSSIEE